ncbi:MAG: Holliday junction branch migration protein RuvA, partial [Geminicoccaceae bacterium]
PQPGRPEAAPAVAGASGDALSALLNLGYARAEAYAAIARVHARLGAEPPLDVLLREGLKELTA